MDSPYAAIKKDFAAIFGADGKLHVVRAPGRVNLIGEHTDYNDGFVFPMAIEPEVRIVCRGREDAKVRLASTIFPGKVAEFSLSEKITPLKGEERWTNYSRGVAAEFLAAGIPLTGMDAYITNTLPVGGGLSSSAALEVGTALCFLALGGLDIDMSRLALLCQKAEHEFAGVPVGIMDQTIVISGRAGHVMLLDCRDLAKQFVPLDSNELRVVIINSMVKHELSAGEYGKRRKECEEGVAYFRKINPAIRALRDVSMAMVDDAKPHLSDGVWRRCRHVVSENGRTQEAARMLTRKEYEKVGQLMASSHASLRDDYEVSAPELDFLSDEAMRVKGVYGARMTGGGFGGCIVALAQPRAVESVVEQVGRSYRDKFGKSPTAFVTTATGGAKIVE
jgi:galactokinase